jgi:hypothetical protein
MAALAEDVWLALEPIKMNRIADQPYKFWCQLL